MVTIGISPKVLVPALGQILVGVALILFGFDVEGKTAIATGLATLATGYASPPGIVVEPDRHPVAADELPPADLEP